VDRLAAVAVACLGEVRGGGLAAAETAIRAAMTALGGSLPELLLGADPGHRGQRVDCGQGHAAEFISYRDKIVDTALGPITVLRAYYHCAACGRGVIPRDDELGVTGVSLSPGPRTMIAHAAAAVPFARARELLAELAGIAVSTKRVERSAEADGQAAAEQVAAEAHAVADRTICLLPPTEAPDTVYVTIDGTGCPMVPAETEGRPGKGPDGKAGTREVKLACVFTQTRLDDDGYPIRDKNSSSYLASFAPAAEFGVLMAAEAKRRGIEAVRQPVIIGDGAVWIWNPAAQHFPQATQIVDLYHAREHLHQLANMIAFIHGGPNTDPHHDWLDTQLERLDAGHIEALCNTAYDLPITGVKAADRDKALAYFEVPRVFRIADPLGCIRKGEGIGVEETSGVYA
jgi:hypothetical protein